MEEVHDTKMLLTFMEARKQREKKKLVINYKLQGHATSAPTMHSLAHLLPNMLTSYKSTNRYIINQPRAFTDYLITFPKSICGSLNAISHIGLDAQILGPQLVVRLGIFRRCGFAGGGISLQMGFEM